MQVICEVNGNICIPDNQLLVIHVHQLLVEGKKIFSEKFAIIYIISSECYLSGTQAFTFKMLEMKTSVNLLCYIYLLHTALTPKQISYEWAYKCSPLPIHNDRNVITFVGF